MNERIAAIASFSEYVRIPVCVAVSAVAHMANSCGEHALQLAVLDFDHARSLHFGGLAPVNALAQAILRLVVHFVFHEYIRD